MKEKVHDHILGELTANTKTDTIFILTSILLNFIALAINASLASSGDTDASDIIIFTMFVFLVLIINIVAIVGLLRGKLSRKMLLEGLMKLYKDEAVDGYYDPSVLDTYNVRYNLFIVAVVSTGMIAILVPIVVLIAN